MLCQPPEPQHVCINSGKYIRAQFVSVCELSLLHQSILCDVLMPNERSPYAHLFFFLCSPAYFCYPSICHHQHLVCPSFFTPVLFCLLHSSFGIVPLKVSVCVRANVPLFLLLFFSLYHFCKEQLAYLQQSCPHEGLYPSQMEEHRGLD